MVLDHSATASRNILAGPRRGGLGGGAPQAPGRNPGPAPAHATMAAAHQPHYRHDPYRSDFSRIEVSPQRDGGSTTAMKMPPRPQFWGPAYGGPQHPQAQMYHPQGGTWQPQQHQQQYGYYGEQQFQHQYQQQQPQPQQYNYNSRPPMPPSPPLPPSALAAPFVPQSASGPGAQQQQQQGPPQPQPPTKILSPLAAALTASYPTGPAANDAALAAATKGALIGAGIAAAGAYQHPSFDAASSLTAGLATDGNERSVSGGAQSLAAPRSARTEASVMSSAGLEAANGDDEPTAQQQGLECQHLLDHVSYAPVSAVRDATRHGESRKVGTRIGEAIAPWEAPEAGPGAGSSTHYRGEPLTTVFVAQLPFDLPLSAMQHVADAAVPGPRLTLLQGAPHMRKGRAYDGCAFFRMPESDAARFVAAIHKRVLFDVDGVWVAQSDEQQQRLMSYCRWMQEKRPDERRRLLPRPTPFSAMTAEYALRGMPRQPQPQGPNQVGNFGGNFSGNQPQQPFTEHPKSAGQDSRRISK